jgi:hypothetical protein
MVLGQGHTLAGVLLLRSSQGYLGVDLADVDNEKAQALKLKDTHGALITLIDHDAPAGKVGLHVGDVVVQLNGKAVDNAEQLRKMLKELSAGHKIALEISREGVLQTLNTQLADRRVMEHDVWNKLGRTGDPNAPQSSTLGLFPGGGEGTPSGGFHMPFFGSNLNVGALVEPLTTQMASYMGVPSGLMVKQVARKSEAAAAGLQAFDVILKVGSESISTSADWERALHSNQGKPVQVTILRDKKQQIVTLQVDSKRRSGLDPPLTNGLLSSLGVDADDGDLEISENNLPGLLPTSPLSSSLAEYPPTNLSPDNLAALGLAPDGLAFDGPMDAESLPAAAHELPAPNLSRQPLTAPQLDQPEASDESLLGQAAVLAQPIQQLTNQMAPTLLENLGNFAAADRPAPARSVDPTLALVLPGLGFPRPFGPGQLNPSQMDQMARQMAQMKSQQRQFLLNQQRMAVQMRMLQPQTALTPVLSPPSMELENPAQQMQRQADQMKQEMEAMKAAASQL